MTEVKNKSELGPFVESTGIGVVLFHVFVRLMLPTDLMETAMDMLVHASVWIGAGLWFLGRAMQTGFVLRISGLEIPLLLWMILCLISILQASYKLPALEHAFVFSSLALVFWWFVTAAGPGARSLIPHLLTGAAFAIGLYALFQYFVLLPIMREEALPGLAADDPFAIRLRGAEAWGTFVYPNTFAGFLVLMLPFLFGSLRDSRESQLLVVLKGGAFLVCSTAFVLTGSMGGFVALGVAAATYGLLLLVDSRPALKKPLFLGAGILVITMLTLIVVGPLSPGKLPNRSMNVRDVYWKSAVQTARANPLGIGLDNFQDFYPEKKDERQFETRKVHNDYLQILVEMGIPGLLIFVLIMGLLSKSALSKPRDDLPEPPQFQHQYVLLIVALSLGGLFVVFWTSVYSLAILVPWLGFTVVAWKPDREVYARSTKQIHLGAGAGFVGLLAHMFVDYDFYDFGVATALMLTGAFLVVNRKYMTELRGGQLAAGAGGAILLLIVLPVLLFVIPPLMQAEQSLRNAEDFLLLGDYDGAADEIDSGLDSTILDSRLLSMKSEIHMRTWKAIRGRRELSLSTHRMMTPQEGLAQSTIEDVLRGVRPRNAGLHHQKAILYLQFYNHYRDLASLPEAGTEYGAWAQGHLSQAESAIHEAVRLYPTLAAFHYWKAYIMDILKRKGAIKEYQRALDLAAQAETDDSPPRLRLPPYERALCLLRVGKDAEAVDSMLGHIKSLIIRQAQLARRQLTAPEVEQLLQSMKDKPRDHVHEWYDSVMEGTLEKASMALIEEMRGARK